MYDANQTQNAHTYSTFSLPTKCRGRERKYGKNVNGFTYFINYYTLYVMDTLCSTSHKCA